METSKSIDWKRWQNSCKGLHVTSLLYFCEEPDRVSQVEKALSKLEGIPFPERVVLAWDQPEIKDARHEVKPSSRKD
jgi:hypothetical protein